MTEHEKIIERLEWLVANCGWLKIITGKPPNEMAHYDHDRIPCGLLVWKGGLTWMVLRKGIEIETLADLEAVFLLNRYIPEEKRKTR